jgi:hypothetical protein
MHPLALVPVGAAVGLLGSLIGVGGGFFVVPFLLLYLGGFTKEAATAASLGIVLFSAASATLANARRGRIDYRAGALLALGSLPGAWAGRELIGRISARAFSWSFAGLLAAVAAYLVLVKLKPGRGALRGTPRELTDRDGQVHRYEVNPAAGAAVSVGVGVFSSLFGVGGGLLLVPFLVVAYGMPTLVATSTAQFAFVWTALVGLLEALRRGNLTAAGLEVWMSMGVGVIAGAQAGVALAKRVPEKAVKWTLAAVILLVAGLMIRQG